MKKRITNCLLALCVLLTLFPLNTVAVEPEKLPSPTELIWGKNYYEISNGTPTDVPGMISWLYEGSDSLTEVRLNVFQVGIDNEVYSSFHVGGPSTSYRPTTDEFIRQDLDSGSYFFTLQTLGDGIRFLDSEVVSSDIWTYTKPSAQLEAVPDPKWAWPLASWSASENSYILGYEIKFYYSKTQEGEKELIDSRGAHGGDPAIYNGVLNKYGSGYYSFKIRALSKDITVYQNGPWSEMSEAYYLSETPSHPTTTLDHSMFRIDTTPEIYDGTAQTKNITCALAEGIDYTVAYSNNVDVGTATITITGIGNYSGTLTYTFSILSASSHVMITEIVPPRYDACKKISGGIVPVMQSGKWGLIDLQGKELTPLQYDNVTPVSEGMAAVMLGEKWGFVNASSQECIAPKYDSVSSFSEGLAVAELEGQWFFVDETGTETPLGSDYTSVWPLADGLALVAKGDQDGQQCGFIDRTGHEVVPLQYTGAGSFSEGLAYVEKENEDSSVKGGYIDTTGRELCALKYDRGDVSPICQEGMAPVKLNGKWGFLDSSGTEAIPPLYDSVGVFSEGIVHAALDGKYGFIDRTGRELTSFCYMEAGNFSEGMAAVCSDTGKYGFIDTAGQEIIPPQYDYAGDFSNGLASVQQGDKWGFVDKMGREVIRPQYSDPSFNPPHFSEGFAVVELDGEKSIIDTNGNFALSASYDSIEPFANGTAIMSLNGKYGLLAIGAAPVPTPISLTAQMFTVDTSSVRYTGTPITKSISGQNGETPLIPDVDYTVSYANNVNVGTAVITITGIGAYSGNLTFSFPIEAAPTESGPSGGGSSGGSSSGGGSYTPSYTVSAPSNIKNGSVQFSSKNAKKGDVVTITVSPDKGYQFSKLTVTDKNGKALKLTNLGNGKFSFIMPGSKVTVDIVFEEAPPTPTPSPSPAEPTQSPDESAPVSDRFSDIKPTDWFISAVQYVCDKGMMNGMGTDVFTPQASASRAMLVTILHRLEGEPAADGTAFSDVPGNGYYAGAVAWASANHIVNGFEDNSFRPDNSITREQLAVILYRYATQKGLDTTASVDLSGFVDLDLVSDYALPALSWANATGLITGTDWGGLYPGGPATRAEAAAILMRFCENILIK